MRLSLILATAAGMAALTACSSLVSLNSFAPDGMVVQNPALPGVWADDENMYVIKAKDLAYTITMVPKDKNAKAINFNARLFRTGNAEILDLVETGDDDPFRIAVHTPVRVWVDEQTLKFAWLESKWLRSQAREQLALQDVGDRVLITAPGDAVMKFVLLNGADDRAFEGDPAVLHRQ